MGRLAFVFPGQGSQSVGMGAAVAAACPAAAALLAEAVSVLGERLARLIAEGPADELDRTVNAQPALLATSMAYLTGLRERAAAAGVRLQPAFAAGHSMGQYSALVAAGAVSMADGLRLVRERGRLMQASGEGRPGAMAAIIGLDDARLPELVERASTRGVFELANRNAPGQVVVSGEGPAVAAALEIARELGARRSVLLPISVAAHSPLMADAATTLSALLDTVHFVDPEPPLVGNATGQPIRTADAARRELVEHLTAGVDWVAAIGMMARAGVDTFVEVGPGRVLTGLIKRIAPEARALALDDRSASDGLAAAAVEAALEASAETVTAGSASSS
jgi:[acyl-carrier-protein] S-malonyltransferase